MLQDKLQKMLLDKRRKKQRYELRKKLQDKPKKMLQDKLRNKQRYELRKKQPL